MHAGFLTTCVSTTALQSRFNNRQAVSATSRIVKLVTAVQRRTGVRNQASIQSDLKRRFRPFNETHDN